MTAPGSPSRILRLVLFGGCALLLALVLLCGELFLRVPDFSSMRQSVEVPIKNADGKPSVKRVGPMTSDWVPFSGISPYLAKAVVASEDTAFYQHQGIDVAEMRAAFKKDWKEGRFARGASTLTQQVLKNVYLLHLPRVWRKVKEIAWAGALEKALSKREILTFYLNMAEWGPGVYGAGHAARVYFGVPASQLSARQSAFLAMLLPAPRRYFSYFKKRSLTSWAAQRVDRILTVMNHAGMIDDAEYQAALNEQLWGKPVEGGAGSDPGNLNDEEGDGFVATDSSSRPSGAQSAPATTPASPNENPAPEAPKEAPSEETTDAP